MKTSHGLTFEVADHFKVIGLDDGYGWQNFRVGTCEGLWSNAKGAYRILALLNKEPHNGHLDDVFEYFQHSAKRDGLPLIVHEVMNKALGRSLLRKDFLPMFGTRDFKWYP